MKKKPNSVYQWRGRLLSFLLIMCMNLPSFAGVQQGKVNLQMSSVSVQEVIEEIGNQTGIGFLYRGEELKAHMIEEINFTEKEWEEVLTEILEPIGKTFKVEKDLILIVDKPKESPKSEVSQEKKSVKGKVVDDQGIPLPGVSVVIKGTNVGVATNIDGEYYLEFEQKNVVLVYSFVGMTPKEIAYRGQGIIDITLAADEQSLAEVVCTGYQTISKERSTGSFAVISSKELDQQISDNIYNKIQNSLPGVKIDSDNNIIIRGQGTLTGDTRPLVVVDGFPMEGDISQINPDDVANITVLKDAASASIWGVRAGNGVIVITTKQGAKAGKPNVEASYSFTIEDKFKFSDFNLMNASDAVAFEEDRLAAGWGTTYNTLGSYNPVQELYFALNEKNEINQQEYQSKINTLKSYDAYKQFEDEFFRYGNKHQFNVSVSGGSEKMKYYNSIMYVDNKSGSVGNKDNRFVINSKTTFDLAKGVKLFSNVNVEYKNAENNAIPYTELMGKKAYEPLKDNNGEVIQYYDYYNKWISQEKEALGYLPYSQSLLDIARYNDDSSKRLSARVQVGLKAELMDGLTLDSKFQYETGFTRGKNFQDALSPARRKLINDLTLENLDPITGLPDGTLDRQIPISGALTTSTNQYYSWNFRNQLSFNKQINEDHSITAIAGFEIMKYSFENEVNGNYAYDDETLSTYAINLEGLNNGEVKTWSNGSYGMTPTEYLHGDDRNVSVFTNASYSFKNKYTASVSGRIDQSNLFGKSSEFKYNPIWSAGLGWVISEEDFFQSSVVDYLKLRVTYGINGNTNKKYYPVLTGTPGVDFSSGLPVIWLSNPANDKLKWENNYTTNIGLNYGLFNGKIRGSFEFYKKDAKDVIGPTAENPTNGFTTSNINFASIENKGVEVSVNANIIRTSNFSWDMNASFTYNKNEVTKVGTVVSDAVNLTNPVANFLGEPMLGKPVGRIYSYRWAGLDNRGQGQIYDKEGNIQSVRNQNRDPELLKYEGTQNAPYFGGLSNTFKYKNLSLTTIFNYQFGNVMYMPKGIVSGDYFTKDLANRWKVAGDELTTNTPGIDPGLSSFMQTNYYDRYWALSDINVESAAFVKLKDIILSYDVPRKALSNIGLNQLTFNLQLRNMWMWTKNSMDIDPERVNSNIASRWDHYNIPGPVQPKTIILGVKASF